MVPVSRLRHWFALGAIVAVLVVAGTYFYARHRLQNALKEVPGRMGIEIQQSAQGFTVSKSEEGHTIFKIQASKAVQYKQGGLAELHDVQITVYGRDSSRFDQVYGSDFEYDPQRGTATAKGQVQIDLEANPAGLNSPDQTAPQELKNPIHLVTSNLVFNKDGDASTREKVTFSIPQATGSAVGVSYLAKTSTLTLLSDVQVEVKGPDAATLAAERATITKTPRTITFIQPRIRRAGQFLQAAEGTLFLRPDNALEHMLARGDVRVRTQGKQPAEVQAAQLDLILVPPDTLLRTATFSGGVHLEGGGPEPMEGQAGTAVVNFSGKNILNSVRAGQNVRLIEHQKSAAGANAAQDVEIQASAMDFRVAGGRRLDLVQTPGAGKIMIRPTGGAAAGQDTEVTAARLEARFTPLGQLASVHGAPEARIVNHNPGQPDGVSTSDALEATFTPGHAMESIVQQGNVTYSDGQRKAWGEHARYTLADQMLTLTGSPRVSDGGMTTTARTMRLNRSTGDAVAEGEVKTTYSDLKPEPNGALLASGSPIHVTAQGMTAHRSPAVALYTGAVRLWQDANVVEAPSIEFDRDHRSVLAQGSASHAVSTVLVETSKQGKVTPVNVSSARLAYADAERRAHFQGNVIARGADYTLTARQMDVYLQARGISDSQAVANAGKIDRVVAEGDVSVTQPARKATGDRLIYTSADEKFVLTGGPPSIFDAERGKITGVSLTFYEHDDRVQVEGSATSPSVTETRVAR